MYVPFFQLYGCIIDEQNCKIFKAHVMMTRYSIYCGRILPIQLTHLSSSPVCVCVCVVGASAHFNYTVQCCQPQSPCVYSSFGLYASYVSKFVPFYQPLFTSLFPTGPGSHFSAVSVSLFVCSSPHTSDAMQSLSFFVWLIPLSVMPVGSIYVRASDRISFFLTAE